MSIRNFLTLILFSLIFSACENSTDVSIDLPYTEYTVINAQLSANKIFDGVTITHTLPLGTQFDIKKAEIKDAVAYILEDGTRVIPLHYDSDGLYKPVSSVGIDAGKQYEFFAEIGSKSIYSKTVVPEIPVVVQVANANNEYLSAMVKANPGEAYGAAWIISGNSGDPAIKADDFHSIETTDHFPSDVLVRTKNIPAPYNTPTFSNSFYIQVYAFDKAFKDYFLTKTGANQIDNTFTSGGGTVTWNVYGKNVIGLFIGKAEGNAVHP